MQARSPAEIIQVTVNEINELVAKRRAYLEKITIASENKQQAEQLLKFIRENDVAGEFLEFNEKYNALQKQLEIVKQQEIKTRVAADAFKDSLDAEPGIVDEEKSAEMSKQFRELDQQADLLKATPSLPGTTDLSKKLKSMSQCVNQTNANADTDNFCKLQENERAIGKKLATLFGEFVKLEKNFKEEMMQLEVAVKSVYSLGSQLCAESRRRYGDERKMRGENARQRGENARVRRENIQQLDKEIVAHAIRAEYQGVKITESHESAMQHRQALMTALKDDIPADIIQGVSSIDVSGRAAGNGLSTVQIQARLNQQEGHRPRIASKTEVRDPSLFGRYSPPSSKQNSQAMAPGAEVAVVPKPSAPPLVVQDNIEPAQSKNCCSIM
jgi:hypothetical protein